MSTICSLKVLVFSSCSDKLPLLSSADNVPRCFPWPLGRKPLSGFSSANDKEMQLCPRSHRAGREVPGGRAGGVRTWRKALLSEQIWESGEEKSQGKQNWKAAPVEPGLPPRSCLAVRKSIHAIRAKLKAGCPWVVD